MKNVKNNKLNRQVAVLFMIMAFVPSFVFGADNGLQGLVNALDEWLQQGIIKPMLWLVLVGIGFYVAKNHDRIKEIWVMCAIIFCGILLILNAKKISDNLLTWMQ